MTPEQGERAAAKPTEAADKQQPEHEDAETPKEKILEAWGMVFSLFGGRLS